MNKIFQVFKIILFNDKILGKANNYLVGSNYSLNYNFWQLNIKQIKKFFPKGLELNFYEQYYKFLEHIQPSWD